jgi:sarcosine oxidase subunit alpha
MSDRRIPTHPAQRVDRSHALTFTLDGKRVPAYGGDTIAAALCASDIDTLSRSFKYHRRRGLLCAAGRCANCLMTVDGVPNVRICLEPVREGSAVRSQHAWPSLEHDAQSVLDWFGALLPVGFYYKTFMRPQWLWPTYEKILRRLAGLGRLDPTHEPGGHSRVLHEHADVLVVGAGPAGIAAALEAERLGADVVLVNDGPALGGHLLWSLLASDGKRPDYQRARELAALVAERPRIRVFTNATAFGLYEGRLVALAERDRLTKVRAARVIVAAGGFEHPLVFQNNDLPGVYLSEGIQRLIALYGVIPGRRAVVIVNHDRGLRAARELASAGIEIAAVADARATSQSPGLQALQQSGVPVLFNHTVLEAHGTRRIERVTLVALDTSNAPVPGSERAIDTDLLVLATGWEPNTTLIAQDSHRLAYREELGGFFPAALPSWLFVAGEVNGAQGLDAILRDGTRAGLSAATSLGPGAGAEDAEADPAAAPEPTTSGVRPLFVIPHSKSKQFVCLCEDVSVKDLRDAVAEGFEDIQTLKRYSTVTMGPCQGRMCHQTSVHLCAAMTQKSASATGTTTARPPAVPVPLGVLAGPAHDVVRRTPMHHWHESERATWTDMGAWKRPLVYSTVEAECRAVRERVGIIDLGTLGKLDVKGKDAAAFLEWVHPNRIANLKPGRIRYRLMLDEAGIIVDDGTIANLGDDHFFVTTGTGALEMVEQRFERALAEGSRCVHVTNVTGTLGAINVAGPLSRQLLERLSDVDLSREGFPYLAATHGRVAGVPALIMRIGFLGELSYELHFPAEYGQFLWETLLEAGDDLGIAPFGVEAQRILRLEKLHIIPGHDTDALTNPFEADMAWTIKLDKPDFVGRAALVRAEKEPLRQRLVGFEMRERVVPGEGAAIVERGLPVGRVTSAKRSPTLGHTIGLAWVPPPLAVAGGELQIQCDGRMISGHVVLKPFYDPDGERLRG